MGQTERSEGMDPRWAALGGGAAGLGAGLAYQSYEKVKTRANLGAGIGVAHLGLALLNGQDALNEANAAVTAYNAVQTTAAPATADGALIRTGGLALARAVQKLSMSATLGLNTSNQTTTSSTLTAAAPATSYLGLAVAIAAYFAFKD